MDQARMNNAAAPLMPDALLELMDGDIQILMLVQGTLEGGRAHWAYVSIPPSRYQAFKDAEAAGSYNLALFGQILAHGDGAEPPQDVRERMKEEHGADHRFEEDLAACIEELRKMNP